MPLKLVDSWKNKDIINNIVFNSCGSRVKVMGNVTDHAASINFWPYLGMVKVLLRSLKFGGSWYTTFFFLIIYIEAIDMLFSGRKNQIRPAWWLGDKKIGRQLSFFFFFIIKKKKSYIFKVMIFQIWQHLIIKK